MWLDMKIKSVSTSRAGSRSAAELSSPAFRYRAGERGPHTQACGVEDSNYEAFTSLIQTCQNFFEIPI